MMNNLLTFASVAKKTTQLLSSVVRIRFLLAMFLMLCVSTNVWGADYDTTYGYSDKGEIWTLTNCTDKDSYWLCPASGTTSVATIADIFEGKTITSDVVITINNATYGSGTNPSANTFKIYTSSECTSQVTATQSGTLASSSTYVNTIYTITKANAANFSADLAIEITKPGRQIRLKSIQVQFSYTDAAPAVNYDVTWKVNGENYTTGSPTTSVAEGSKVTTLPTDPTLDCGGKIFVGWSNQPVTDGSEPDVLFTTAENSPDITAETTFYAVFAAREGEETLLEGQTTTISGDISGTKSGVLSWSSAKNDANNDPVWNTSSLEFRFYYQSEGNGCSMTINAEEGVTITGVKITASSTSYTPTVKYNVDGGADQTGTWSSTTMTITGLNTTSSFKFRNANTTNKQFRFKNVVVTYSKLSGEYTYSDYTTSCTTETVVCMCQNSHKIGIEQTTYLSL